MKVRFSISRDVYLSPDLSKRFFKVRSELYTRRTEFNEKSILFDKSDRVTTITVVFIFRNLIFISLNLKGIFKQRI